MRGQRFVRRPLYFCLSTICLQNTMIRLSV
nr:MAG TPA: hypothetical protein [Caudoviricetes sp.]